MTLEYGVDTLELHARRARPRRPGARPRRPARYRWHRRALCDLTVGLGAEIVGCAFLVELSALKGRGRLSPHPVHALIDYAE